MATVQSGLDIVKVLNTVTSLVPHAGAVQPVLTATQGLLERAQVGWPISVISDSLLYDVETQG